MGDPGKTSSVRLKDDEREKLAFIKERDNIRSNKDLYMQGVMCREVLMSLIVQDRIRIQLMESTLTKWDLMLHTLERVAQRATEGDK